MCKGLTELMNANPNELSKEDFSILLDPLLLFQKHFVEQYL